MNEEDVFRKKQPPTFGLFEQEAFAVPTAKLRGMVRGSDPIESQVAAARVLRKVTATQQDILALLAVVDGPMTARELEQAPSFAHLGYSTVRKRICELKQMGRIVQDGRKDGMGMWALAPANP